MRGVAIVSPVRTAVGNFGGALRDVPAAELASTVIQAALERSGVDPAKVDDVILGHGYPSGENPAIGRLASLKAGLPIEVPGYQLDRRCSSGLQAILNASMLIQTENADVVIAGGAESMSSAEFYSNESRWGARFGSVTFHDRLARARVTIAPDERFGPIPGGMVETAENLAREYEIPREEQDEYALRSHQRAVAARDSGKFADEIVPVSIPQRRGDPKIFDADEGPRADTTMEVLGRLRPVMRDGVVTAGNASSQNDAASVCLVVAEDKLEELGLEPMAFLRGWAVTGCHPATMGIGPGAGGEQGHGQDRHDAGRHGHHRAERGLRGPGARRAARVAVAPRGQPERQRLRHLPGPSHRGHRRPHPHHHAPRDAAPGRPVGPGDHVRRRRPGRGGGVRAEVRLGRTAVAFWLRG